jgi:hypothetical protein
MPRRDSLMFLTLSSFLGPLALELRTPPRPAATLPPPPVCTVGLSLRHVRRRCRRPHPQEVKRVFVEAPVDVARGALCAPWAECPLEAAAGPRRQCAPSARATTATNQ